ncbi:CIC11C00000002212 [Sungouiella intermedia]|uniref:CIC11C00000002212 n=1 Tax=Sungouiella intermedia TaxID=45354 RepID=A0A1L0BH05_9ASCO|nr:CIC11C00000002212 [[Candida] intermedia]
MASISKLDDRVAVQIRSHLVINSVECVVRELLVNALEANSTKIIAKIDLETLSVCFEDNGNGIRKEDLESIYKRYHSSKNLENRTENGAHRGEALNSIIECSGSTVVESMVNGQATSHFDMSKAPDLENIVSVVSNYFETTKRARHGTTIMITRLFSRSPVRYQYLKKGYRANWLKRVLKPLLFEILHEYPKVRVDIQIRSGSHFDKVLTLENIDNARELFSTLFILPLDCLVPINGSDGDYCIEGFVCVESFRSNLQYVFFNGQRANLSRGQSTKLLKIFHNYGRYAGRQGVINKAISKGPTFYINVRYSRKVENQNHESKAFEFVKQLLVFSLEKLGYILRTETPPSSQRYTTESLDANRSNDYSIAERETSHETDGSPISVHTLSTLSMILLEEGNFKLVKQILALVILITTNGCLYAIDQHACDERIQLEDLLEEFIGNVLDPLCDLSVKCTDPISFSVSSEDKQDFDESIETLLQYGIRYTIQNNTIRLTHLPLVMAKFNDSEALKECLLQFHDDLKDRKKVTMSACDTWFLKVKNIPSMIYEAFVSQACKLSVKFGDTLTDTEMEYLVVKLGRCILPFQCAHGRPTIVEVDYEEPVNFTEDMDIK